MTEQVWVPHVTEEGSREHVKYYGQGFGVRCSTPNCEVNRGPWGCRCQTLHHRIAGDGCDICQPSTEGGEDEE